MEQDERVMRREIGRKGFVLLSASGRAKEIKRTIALSVPPSI